MAVNTTHEPTDLLTIPGIVVDYGFVRQTVYDWMAAGMKPDAFIVDGTQRRPVFLRVNLERWIDDPIRSKRRPKNRVRPRPPAPPPPAP